jgi:hypothetical protein
MSVVVTAETSSGRSLAFSVGLEGLEIGPFVVHAGI